MDATKLVSAGGAILVTGVLLLCLANPLPARSAPVAAASAHPAVGAIPATAVDAAATAVATTAVTNITPVVLANGGLIDSTFAQVASALLFTAAMLVASVNVVSTPSVAGAKPGTGTFSGAARPWSFPAARMRRRALDDASKSSREHPTGARHSQQLVA